MFKRSADLVPELIHFSPSRHQSPETGSPYGEMLNVRSRTERVLDRAGVDHYLVMHDPSRPEDELLFTGAAAQRVRELVRGTLVEHGLDPDNPISSGIDFDRFVRIAATFYSEPPRYGPSHEFGRDQDPENAFRVSTEIARKIHAQEDTVTSRMLT